MGSYNLNLNDFKEVVTVFIRNNLYVLTVLLSNLFNIINVYNVCYVIRNVRKIKVIIIVTPLARKV